MFKKPFKVKSNTQMKGSDKKKLKLELLKNFPVLTAENLKEILPPKDDLSLVKILTYHGETAYFYCIEKLPILFSKGAKLYPTLYLLWRYPNILPFFTTAPEVLPVLQGGADFMAAGVISQKSNDRFGRLNKNDSVYVNLTDNKAAVAMGECALSSHDMYMSAGRGKCVIVLHVLDDELCKFGTVVPLPQHGPVFSKITEPEDKITTHVEENKPPSYANTLKAKDKEPTQIERKTDAGEPDTESNGKLEPEEEEEKEKEENEVLESPDDVLMYCFLKALNTSMKNIKLPVLISNFYKLHMIPACPEGKTIDIKKTSFKKMSKFIQQMSADSLIKIEEPSPGVQSITQINYSHHLISGFVDQHFNNTGSKESTKASEPQVSETYTVTAAVLPMFSEFLIKKGESMTVSQARKYTAEYIRKHQLPLPNDNSVVRLDPVLKTLISQGNANDAPETAKWEEIMNRVLYKMSRSFKITTDGNSNFKQKGKLPMIDIRIANKAGSKKVTLINNLEAYGINIEEFSRECQRGVAASATINQVNGLKTAQLQIQGNQINFIEKILTGKYNIPKKFINGLQFAPKKK